MSTPADAVLEELRERVMAAHAARRPLRLRGAGTKDFYGESLEGEILDVRPWHGIVAYDPSELVITARCGTPLSQIESALLEHAQLLELMGSTPSRRPTGSWSRRAPRRCTALTSVN